MNSAHLQKRIKLVPLILYGVGTILGAGIYVIISEVASTSGSQFPLAFIVASFIAVFVGLSYAELSSLLPKSAGEAVYVNKAFGSKILNIVVGYAVAITGVITSATIIKGFHGYLGLFFSIPWWTSATALAALLGLVAIKGIKESVFLISLITLVEIIGLLLVIFFGSSNYERLPELMNNWKSIGYDNSIFMGAFIAFFSFIGFEDMVNTAEEVIDAPKNMPKAILLSIIISTLIYFFVTIACAISLSIEELKSSTSPLVLVITKNSSMSPKLMGVIALISIVNGALVQMIMVSRMLYGMAKIEVAPKLFSKISSKTHTPINATVFTVLIIWILAILFPIGKLAQATSFIIICVFVIICSSLIKIKLAKEYTPSSFKVNIIIPIIGLVLCLLFLCSYLVLR